jgi:pyruvate dehydrogenase E2 component (dihydrolipoamide acetyltransferase)
VAREFRLPDIGEGLTEAEVVRWLVPVGEHVDADQPVVEVETDKAVVEIPSPFAGIVLEHGAAEGETLDVGAVLLVIGEAEEAEEAEPQQTGDADDGMVWEEPASVAVHEPEPVVSETLAAPIVGSLSEEAEMLDVASSPDTLGVGPGVKALPLVRKLARESGVDLTQLTGSGPEGRITREDVLATAAGVAGPETTPRPEVAAESEIVATGVKGDERRRMSRLRRTIAANMSRSWAEIPHVTTFDDVDATRLFEVRAALAERHDTPIPVEALVLKAVLPALEAYPEFNATLDGDDLILHHDHDIGIAVDTLDGLLVAVIKDADSKSVIELAAEVKRLGEAARERSLAPDDLTGQTFTVSNIGAVAGGHGTPIVPPGTTAILSVGRAKSRAVVYGDDLGIAPVMPLSLSYDHRVVDGGLGRRFMALVIENLEEPALFLAG